jgi:acetyl esterase/lipase
MTIQVMAPIWWCCARLSPQVNARPPQRSAGPRLGQAGVPVEFHLHPGAPHEFDFVAFNTTAARRHRRPRSFEHRMPLSLTGGCRAASPDK